MPKFNKSVDELETRFEKWLYVIKNLGKLDRIPEKLKERVFEKLFDVAEIAKFTKAEAISYEDSLKYYRDLKNVIDTAKEEGEIKGRAEGEKEGRIAVATNLLNQGFPVQEISNLTGLSIKEVEALKA